MNDGTRILTSDLRWVRVADLAPGEQVLAFDENTRDASQEGYKRRGRLFRCARIESVERIHAPCYDLEFDDGTKIRCPAEHGWLCGKNHGVRWITTENLVIRNGQASRVLRPLDTWKTGTSREAGYLAAAFDGEGNLVQRELGGQVKGVTGTLITFSQVSNYMLAETERCLKLLDFYYGHNIERRDSKHWQDMHRLNICRRSDFLRFLGSVRPVRLLPKLRPDKLGLLNHGRSVRLVRKTFAGHQETVALQTGTRTFFAEGLASHA